MTRQERAKQFAPFDSMKGLSEALRDREERHSRVERHDISEEQIEKNSEMLIRINKGMKISVDCYCAFHDITRIGTVSEINFTRRYISIDGEKVFFADIYDIRMVDI